MLAAPAASASAGDAMALGAIDRVVDEEIAAGRVPGAVVLVGRGDEILYRKAFGARVLVPERVPMTEDTIFDLASLTKAVATAPAVMQLVERGRLRLASPAARYWPAFGANGKRPITVVDLLLHASGLRADLDLRPAWSGYDATLERVAAERPSGAPGVFRYGDLNFIVLGELVRRVSGLPVDVYCAQRLFAPLRMTDTGFLPDPARRDRVAPTDVQEGVLRWGEVSDPTARRMGGVAGHAGLFSTADDLARFARALLHGGELDGTRVLSSASVAEMIAPHKIADGRVERGLGWDRRSPYASGMEEPFGPASFGHTGYTGTSLWIDPASGTYLVVLTSRLHPAGQGDARPLRRRLAEVVAGAIRPPAAPLAVATGIDVLEREGFAPLRGKRVGLITNQTGLDAAGRRTADVLHEAPDVSLVALFSPEHGPSGDAEGRVASSTDAAMGLPVYSLYGATRRPTDEMLEGLDALVFDVQDAGARFYTYSTTMAYAMEAAARRGLDFFVLDRPNPIDGDIVQGPLLEPDLESFTGYAALPVRHGLTMGELARLFDAEKALGAKLHVIRMEGYRRASWYDETGLRWVPPSPNLRSVEQAVLYPGVALVEGANVSVGRGTDAPFEQVGAPWLDGAKLAARLARRGIAGVRFTPTDFVPDAAPYRGRRCRGVRIELVDRKALDAPALGVELAGALHTLHPDRFRLRDTLGMVGARWVVDALAAGGDPRAIARRWEPALAAFRERRAAYLLY